MRGRRARRGLRGFRGLLALAFVDILLKRFSLIHFVLADGPDGLRVVALAFAAML